MSDERERHFDKIANELIDGLKLRGIQYNEDLCCEETPWESVAEPEPVYFSTFLQAYDFQMKLAEQAGRLAALEEAAQVAEDDDNPHRSPRLAEAIRQLKERR